MPDGTIKQLNPFTGTEVWSVPGRANKPLINEVPKTAKRLGPFDSAQGDKESYCAFCEARYFETPPEKGRVVVQPHPAPLQRRGG